MTTPLNILLTNSSGIYAGGEFYILEVARTLQSRGHHVHVCCKPGNRLREKCETIGVPTIPLDFPPQGRLLHYVIELKKIIREHSIQIIHTNTNYDRTAGAFAAWGTTTRHVTNVHSFHSLQHNLTHWVRNRFATDHFIVDGECVKDLLVREDNIPAEKISVVYLGVDPTSMIRDDTERRRVRQEFGFTDDLLLVGNVARLVPFKGHEMLIQAFARVAADHPEARLLLVGDGELERSLKKLTSSLKLDARIMFAGFRDDLTSLYSAFDAYVHPSIEGGGETFPFAVLQALAQQLPVIVTRVGDVPAMIEEGVNGFVVPDRDIISLATKLKELLGSSPLRADMGRRSRERLMKHFTREAMVDSVERVYSAILKTL